MSLHASHPSLVPEKPGHPEQATLTEAWLVWLGLLTVPFLAFFLALRAAMTDGVTTGRSGPAETWFLFVMAYLLVTSTIAFFVRSHFFKPYWDGQPVPPRNYLLGSLALWAALASGGLLASLACLATGSLAPNVAPAAVALVFYFTLIPTGRPMVRRVGREDDPGVYEEPR